MLTLLNIFSLKRSPLLSQFHILLFYVLLFHVLHFHVLSFGPSFSRPAISCPAHWSVNFTSVIFTSSIFSAAVVTTKVNGFHRSMTAWDVEGDCHQFVFLPEETKKNTSALWLRCFFLVGAKLSAYFVTSVDLSRRINSFAPSRTWLPWWLLIPTTVIASFAATHGTTVSHWIEYWQIHQTLSLSNSANSQQNDHYFQAALHCSCRLLNFIVGLIAGTCAAVASCLSSVDCKKCTCERLVK